MLRQPTIFIGEVIAGGVQSIREDPWYSNSTHVRFRVVESFRGLPKNTRIVDMDVMPTDGMCSPNPYFPGRTYLVVPGTQNGKFLDGGCFSGRDIRHVAETVSYLRSYFAGRTLINVHGQVATARDGTGRPLSGVRVSTSRFLRTYSTVSDAEGRYSLTVPAAGEYKLTAELSPYLPSSARALVGDGGCAVSDFALRTGSTISGQVRDRNGHPIWEAKVGLIDLDRPQISTHAFTELHDQGFLFKNVPLGRYVLVFNPEGPQTGGLYDMPLESTYWPHGMSRSEAEAIEVTAAGLHITAKNLTVGEPVSFRPVVVRANFPDGAPMTTAVVNAVGDPAERGDVAWTFAKIAGREDNGVVRFRAPTNRTIRIDIRDRHWRDLKQSYTAIHRAGTSPIDQSFVIVP